MLDEKEKENSDIEFIRLTEHIVWGFLDGETFIALPKLPMVRAGFREPPFTVTLPNGTERNVIVNENKGE